MPSDPKPAAAGESAILDNFLRAVVRSGLLDAPMLQAAREEAPVEARQDAKGLADYFVKVGKLTRFQAGKLLKGVSLGLVFGPYHILSPLGRGGMGSVFLARDSRSQLLVAVKVLPPKQAKAKERLLARFRREMDICRRVAHPNLTRTFEVGEQLGINFIAMEFIPGRDLYHLVREKGPLEVTRAARLFCEVANGLEAAHTLGLIHRDMKPSNIMILPDDHAKVLDLGLALIAGDREPTILAGGQGVLIGTPDYMAPEQGEDPLKVDTRSDIYALGCSLYYALTGQVPFPGGGALQKIVRHKCEPPPPVAKLNPNVPPALASLIAQLMAKLPDDRFQSAAEARLAIEKWLDEQDGEPRPRAADGDVPEAVPINDPVDSPPPEAVLLAPARPRPASLPLPAPPPAKPAPAKAPAAAKPAPAALSQPVPAKPPVAPAVKAPPAATAPPKPQSSAPVPAKVLAAPSAAALEEQDQPQFPPPMPAKPSAKSAQPVENGTAVAEVSAPVASAPAPDIAPAGLPFWLDFVVPVVAATVFLLTVWFVTLFLLMGSRGP